MVLMENGRMDSKSDLCTDPDRFIVINGKEVKSCLNADSTVALQNVENDKSMTVAKASSVLENDNFPNCKGNTLADGSNYSSETMGIVNGDDSSSNHESCTYNISKTNSSQCNANSQKSCCTKLENELSCLSISNCESVATSVTFIDQCSEFCDAISEIVTDQQITDGMNGSSNEISSTHAVDSNSSNSGGDVEKQSEDTSEITYISYESENQMPDIMKLIQKDLSEPYSIYTYRYFIHNWPHLCFLAVSKGESVGAIVCKLDLHRKIIKRGYIAMLAVDECFRKKGIGSNLVLKAIRVMATEGADEVVLETEITNQPALRLYENLGFVRDKRLFRYYLNGVDALRLKLWLR